MESVGDRQTKRSFRAPGFVLVALFGTWLGHTLVWSVTGGASPGLAAVHSVHNYLRPVGIVLVALAIVSSWAEWCLVRRLEATAVALRRRLKRAWRSGSEPSGLRRAPAPLPAGPPSLGGLWASLALVQLCVYLVQENLEALSAHVAAPGIAVLTRQYGTPAAVHVTIALALAVAVWLVLGRVAEGCEAVARASRLFHALTGRRIAVPVWFPAPTPTATPAERFGLTALPRPPPLLAG
jgi:hypothetical protein